MVGSRCALCWVAVMLVNQTKSNARMYNETSCNNLQMLEKVQNNGNHGPWSQALYHLAQWVRLVQAATTSLIYAAVKSEMHKVEERLDSKERKKVCNQTYMHKIWIRVKTNNVHLEILLAIVESVRKREEPWFRRGHSSCPFACRHPTRPVAKF